MVDKFWLWLARRLPRRLLYWSVIHAGSIATSNEYANQEVPSLTVFQMLERL